MKLIEVTKEAHRKEFIQLPIRLYKDVKEWIRPLDKDVEDQFDPKHNKYFTHGECTRWILLNDEYQAIGRVAAFINRLTADTHPQPTGGMGFFECINDESAAFMLFDKCREWLSERGIEAMDGPINFGDRDKWWGLLVDGFHIEPNYCMPYTHPYYISFFENYGFTTYFKQYTYGRQVTGGIHPLLERKAQRIFQIPEYTFQHLELSKLDEYGEDFRSIYNQAWGRHTGVTEMSKEQAQSLMKKMKPIIDEDIIWFAYYNNEPIGFFIMLPELNQIFKHVNGKLDLIGKLKFLYHKWRGTCNKMFGVVFGFIPEHQGKGVEAALISAVNENNVGISRYDYMEMNWIGDFNPKMMRVAEAVGGEKKKVHITYRYLFDRSKEPQHPEMIK